MKGFIAIGTHGFDRKLNNENKKPNISEIKITIEETETDYKINVDGGAKPKHIEQAMIILAEILVEDLNKKLTDKQKAEHGEMKTYIPFTSILVKDFGFDLLKLAKAMPD